MNKQDLISKIKLLDGVTQDERSYLINLVNTKKKYGLVWEDKPEDVEEQLRDNLPVLKEVVEKRILTPPSGAGGLNHILIEGDNLHALTALTFTHEGKIDVIYIDPPYNTGNKDFKYNDHFVDKEDSYRHSKWLSFMDKRLRIAKRLLSEKGVIFISIDDNEVAQLKLLCDEIFGSKNFMSEFIIQSNPRGSQASKYFAVEHEYLITYSKESNPNIEFGLQKGVEHHSDYPLFDDDNIRYRLLGLRQRGGEWRREQRPNMFFPIYINPINGKVNEEKTNEFTIETLPKRPTGEESRWSWGPDKFKNEKELLIGKKVNRKNQPDFWDIFRKDYLENNEGQNKKIKTKTIWDETEINYQNGGNEIKELIGSDMFSFPKPLFLLKKAIGICSFSNNLTILDFFAGSGTTLHATMALNAEDGGNRQCILVTNNENNICEEVTYERNKRVIEGYTNAKGVAIAGLENNNLRYYKADFVPSNKSDNNNRMLTNLSTDLLCIKENCYTDVTTTQGFNPNDCRIFNNNQGKFLIVVYYSRNLHLVCDALKTHVKTMETSQKIKLYGFSPETETLVSDFLDVSDLVDAVPLPEAIYNAYRATFRTLKLDKKRIATITTIDEADTEIALFDNQTED
jgi:adenine-specific DNA-methyltransferase